MACSVRPSPSFGRKTPCAECPWRRDQPAGRFPPERYEKLASTVQQGFNKPLFACHKTQEMACAGFLIVEGSNNFQVRLAVGARKLDLADCKSDVPLFDSFQEMATFNGAAPQPDAREEAMCAAREACRDARIRFDRLVQDQSASEDMRDEAFSALERANTVLRQLYSAEAEALVAR